MIKKLYGLSINKWLNMTVYKLKLIKEDTKNLDDDSNRYNRREQVILTRLRIGHTRLTDEHLMAKENKKICIF